jgi:hypothetical protein
MSQVIIANYVQHLRYETSISELVNIQSLFEQLDKAYFISGPSELQVGYRQDRGFL